MTALQRTQWRWAARNGFTLVELVVSISIAALVVALTIPTLLGAREYVRRAACGSNLHQLGVAASLYSLDHNRALPTHYSGEIVFDSLMMSTDTGERVNLGLLYPYAEQAGVYYCPSQTAGRSPCIAENCEENPWDGQPPGPGGGSGSYGGDGPGPGGNGPGGSGGSGDGNGTPPPDAGENQAGPGPDVNSAFPARCRRTEEALRVPWKMLQFNNRVIYSDFLGVDEWPGRGRLRHRLRAAHQGRGYNSLFGDGSVSWAQAERIRQLRPVSPEEPTPQELESYYDLLDVLP